MLAIDTSLGACSAAVTESGILVAHAFEVLGRGHAERLVPMVQEVLGEANTDFASLDLIAVTVGPGTFTGVRIGLAAARGFALAHGLPLVGVTSTEAVAEAVVSGPHRSGLPGQLAVIHDARRGEIYVQCFEISGPDSSWRALAPAVVIPCGDVMAALPAGSLAVAGTGVALVGKAIAAADSKTILLEEDAYPDARFVARVAVRRPVTDEPVRPLYLRAPDAKLPGAKLPGAM